MAILVEERVGRDEVNAGVRQGGQERQVAAQAERAVLDFGRGHHSRVPLVQLQVLDRIDYLSLM